MEWVEPPPTDEAPPLPGLHPLIGRTLARRGLRTAEAARAFLHPQYYAPTPATEIPGLSAAAERVVFAIQHSEPICVWGDFDVDGQTSTTILVQTLQELGGNVSYHIPIRELEGHGVNIPLLTEIIDHGARLILTCDTGISAVEEVEFASSRGVEVVITDHHDLPDALPVAAAVTNPKLLPEGHPLATLSGSGLAYKLAEELYTRFGRPDGAEQHLDLACLGLVADLARLMGDARTIVQRGLESLRHTTRLGLQAIYEVAKLVPENLTEDHIGYELGPRLNALGRLEDANPAVELFTTTDPSRAGVLATILEGLNIERRRLCNQVSRAAEAQLRDQPDLLDEPVLVVAGPEWPGGVVGLVASRLVERYRKPTIVFSVPKEGPARGSARSVDGLNITAAIQEQKDMLLNFGGHPMAAGLSLEAERLPEFRRRLSRTVQAMLGTSPDSSPLEIDAWLDLGDISMELADALESLAPYGPGNDKLILATHNLKLQSSAKIGRTQEHLKLTVTDEADRTQIVLWWNGADEDLPEGRFDLAYSLRAADWRGTRQVQMEFVDFHLVEVKPVEVKAAKIEVVDCRSAENPEALLEEVRCQASTMVWAEGMEKKRTAGKDRNELEPADNLVIWTTPASPDELRWALDKVHPIRVYLFAHSEPTQTVDSFLRNLAGLLKYAIQHRQGKVTWSDLAAATAQSRLIIRLGMQWLVSQGEISLSSETGEDALISVETSLKDPATASRIWAELQSLLAENAAYRAHFKRSAKDSLLPIIQ